MPTRTCSSDTTRSYRTATGQVVQDGGEKTIEGVDMFGHRMSIRFRVADVTKPLLAVAELVDNGYKVVFEKQRGRDVSRAEYKATGDAIRFIRRGMVFDLDLAVPLGMMSGDVQAAEPSSSSASVAPPDDGAAAQPESVEESLASRCSMRSRSTRWLTSRIARGAVRVAGRGISDRHSMAATGGEPSLPVVAIDYGFFGTDAGEQEKDTPLLCGRDSLHRWYYGVPMPAKGVGKGWAPRALATRIALSGHEVHLPQRRWAFNRRPEEGDEQDPPGGIWHRGSARGECSGRLAE